MADDLEELLETIDLGSARGGKRPAAPLTIEVVRPLTEADLQQLVDSPALATPMQTLGQIRASHHELARLLAQGTNQVNAGLIVGYSQSYISVLKGDPAFKELLAHYQSERESLFIDTLERMRGLGFRALEELEQQLEEAPEKWSRRELMEMADLMLVRPQAAMRGQQQGASGPTTVLINPKFISASGKQPMQNTLAEPIVDLDYEDIIS